MFYSFVTSHVTSRRGFLLSSTHLSLIVNQSDLVNFFTSLFLMMSACFALFSFWYFTSLLSRLVFFVFVFFCLLLVVYILNHCFFTILVVVSFSCFYSRMQVFLFSFLFPSPYWYRFLQCLLSQIIFHRITPALILIHSTVRTHPNLAHAHTRCFYKPCISLDYTTKRIISSLQRFSTLQILRCRMLFDLKTNILPHSTGVMDLEKGLLYRKEECSVTKVGRHTNLEITTPKVTDLQCN